MPFFLLMFLKAKLVAHLFLILLVCAYPLGLSETTLFLPVHRNFKASPSARCISAADAVLWSIDIFNKDCILLTDVSQLFKEK
jgi:hypothetical protein